MIDDHTKNLTVTLSAIQLDTIGELYGVKRREGEPDMLYRDRALEEILKFAVPKIQDERIIGVALKSERGWVISMGAPGRHSDLISEMNIAGIKRIENCEQGFVTSMGRYVNRWQALRVAFHAGQVPIAILQNINRELMSEDVW